MFEDKVTIPAAVITNVLYWLDVLAESNDDPDITATIMLLLGHIEGQKEVVADDDGSPL